MNPEAQSAEDVEFAAFLADLGDHAARFFVRKHPVAAHDFDNILSDAFYGIARGLAVWDERRGTPLRVFLWQHAQWEIVSGTRSRLTVRATQPESLEELVDESGRDDAGILGRSPDATWLVDARIDVERALSPVTAHERMLLTNIIGHLFTDREVATELGVSYSTVAKARRWALEQVRATAHGRPTRHATELSDAGQCRRGHEFTPENSGIRANGTRYCRTCNRQRGRSRRAAA